MTIRNEHETTAGDHGSDDERLHTEDLLSADQDGDGGPDVNGDEQAPGSDHGASWDADETVALLEEGGELEDRWRQIQVRFVDEPRGSVEEADALVADVMRRLAETFADERQKMEREWQAGAEVSTEDLRQALQRYRSFFHRLLSI